jgi:hypothetical protein
MFSVGCINNPEDAARVKTVYDAGHQVASHSWSHKDLATLSKDESTYPLDSKISPLIFAPLVLSEMSSVSRTSCDPT